MIKKIGLILVLLLTNIFFRCAEDDTCPEARLFTVQENETYFTLGKNGIMSRSVDANAKSLFRDSLIDISTWFSGHEIAALTSSNDTYGLLALSCGPSTVAKERLKRIDVITNIDYDSSYVSEDTLNDIVFRYGVDLNQWNSDNPNVTIHQGEGFGLMLDPLPEDSLDITIYFSLDDGRVFESDVRTKLIQ